MVVFFFFSSRRRHTRSLCDWSSDVCSSDLAYIIARTTATQQSGIRDAARATVVTCGEVWHYSIQTPPCLQGAERRSEERRVGKECRSRWAPHPKKKKRLRKELNKARMAK